MNRRPIRMFLRLLFVFAPLSSAVGAQTRDILAREPDFEAFDWDENVMTMPTTTSLYHLTSDAEVLVTMAEFAREKPFIGVSGKYKEYATKGDRLTGSFRKAQEHPSHNYFLEDIVKATPAQEW